MNFVSKTLIFVGILFLFLGSVLYVHRLSPTRLAFAETPQVALMRTTSKNPLRLVIKSLSIDLPIFPAVISNNRWTTSHYGISYLATSAVPGDYGNSILYGHNWERLLGNLKNVKVGDIIEITYDDTSKRTFIISHIQIVSPSDVSILAPTNTPQITLYTCTGFLDSERLVTVAVPYEES